MTEDPDVRQVAAAVRLSISLLLRRLRQSPPDGGLTMPESVALARLEKNGPLTSSVLARLQGISPQSMGEPFAALEKPVLVQGQADPNDGRRALLSLSKEG